MYHVMFTLLVGVAMMGGAMSQVGGASGQAGAVESVLTGLSHYSMVLDLLRSTGLLDQIKQMPTMTLFAPTDEALMEIPKQELEDFKTDTAKLKEFLQFHVSTDMWQYVPGVNSNDKVLQSQFNQLPIRVNVYPDVHSVSAEGVNISEPNIPVSNGYVQGIEGYMVAPTGDMVDIVNSHEDLKTLAQLIATSGLDSVLRNDKNITFFAPVDGAFASLAPEVLKWLQANPSALEEVLLYHVVQSTTLYSVGMRHSMTFPTADHHKDSLMLLETPDGELFLNQAQVGERDISATNGVIHTLEQVLIPYSVLVKLEDEGLGHLIG